MLLNAKTKMRHFYRKLTVTEYNFWLTGYRRLRCFYSMNLCCWKWGKNQFEKRQTKSHQVKKSEYLHESPPSFAGPEICSELKASDSEKSVSVSVKSIEIKSNSGRAIKKSQCADTHNHHVFFVQRFFCNRLIHRRWRNQMDSWRMVPCTPLHYAGSRAEWYPLKRRPLEQHDHLHRRSLHPLFYSLRPRLHLPKCVIAGPLIFCRHVDYLLSVFCFVSFRYCEFFARWNEEEMTRKREEMR